jgi:hypothetical protein
MPGCPILATFLFLSLGWETTNLVGRARNPAKPVHSMLKPYVYPASYCDIETSDGRYDATGLRRAAFSKARRSSDSRRILRAAGMLTWHRDMQLRQRAGTRNSSSRGRSSARKREFRKLADLQYGQFMHSRKIGDCTSNTTGWRRGGKIGLSKNIGQNRPESLQLFARFASFFESGRVGEHVQAHLPGGFAGILRLRAAFAVP